MIFKSFSITSAALLLAAPVIASAKNADAASQFSHDGITYHYITEVAGSERIIRGSAFAGKVPFELHVRGNVVTGTFDHRQVEFTQAEARSAGILVAAN